ncbi:hypothetical protein [Natronomonas salsuginis]|jgi:hypothetical protein|uniref:Uncharacterized protein n=1 Tax=Natronomonas salsuginis TaxID=2217661 RepID=A0A4U5JHY9_9EURY|nr:hypothetical protein [Natronomonas salsuginis]TKR28116.1 hypothetical protein DM868_03285 [Natronomonas salsuginis]
MAYRFVRARPITDRLAELRERLDSGEIAEMKPFGTGMTTALNDAKYDPDTGDAVWIEEDYCTPPLAMEREAVLDDHFGAITIVDPDVDESAGWERIDGLPSLWERVEAKP